MMEEGLVFGGGCVVKKTREGGKTPGVLNQQETNIKS